MVHKVADLRHPDIPQLAPVADPSPVLHVVVKRTSRASVPPASIVLLILLLLGRFEDPSLAFPPRAPVLSLPAQETFIHFPLGQ